MFNKISQNFKRVLITGGAGFIGSNLLNKLLKDENIFVINLDKISYSSDLAFQKKLKVENNNKFTFIKVDLLNEIETRNAINFAKPDLIIHLAAESHVDRSINNPKKFLESNTIGTFNLLEAARIYWNDLPINKKNNFRFIHVSTDEVYGSLSKSGKFSELSSYEPSSPYSASKAASDHFVFAWHKTYSMPTIICNCSNNYGPRQFPEKLIPLTILKILKNEPIPIYGDGRNIRDWLFVEDHIDALFLIASKGKAGQKYCIGGNSEISNLKLIKLICQKLDKKISREKKSYDLISFVKDRPGHDYRYAINYNFIKKQLNFKPKTNIITGIDKTIDWYLANIEWCNLMLKESKYNLTRIGL